MTSRLHRPRRRPRRRSSRSSRSSSVSRCCSSRSPAGRLPTDDARLVDRDAAPSARATSRPTVCHQSTRRRRLAHLAPTRVGARLGARRQPAPTQPRAPAAPAPLVAAPVGTGIGRLVALVLAVGIAVTSTPSAAIAPTPTPRRSSRQPQRQRRTRRSSSDAFGENRRTHRRGSVEQHDSLWRIAETTLGDGERSHEILELNPWLQSARNLKAGQVLTLPATALIRRTARTGHSEHPPAPAPTQVDASIAPR